MMKMAMGCGAYIEFSSHDHMHSYLFFPFFTLFYIIYTCNELRKEENRRI